MKTKLTICLLLILASTCLAQEVVTIDLSADRGPATHRASGFLHAMTATVPEPSLVDPLKPKLFRMWAEDWHGKGEGAFANYARVKKLGARMQVVVSDSTGYPQDGVWPGDDGNWTGWESLVENLVKRAREKRYTFKWDIWNEPNIGYFWKRDQARFFETWIHGYRKIRSVDPKAVIIGPSISGYDRKYLEAFLLHMKANDALPDKLAWHEFGDPKKIPAHADEMRAFMKAQGIKPLPICLNEIINSKQATSPGVTVHYLANLERAGVDGACHACWGDETAGVSACENQSLDGILTHPDKQPRSTWWAYKGYADVTGRLIDLRPSATVDGVAGIDPKTKMVHVVLGRDGKESGPVDVEFLNGSGKVFVHAERIPASGWKALVSPEVATVNADTAEPNRVRVTLPDLSPSDAYIIRLSVRKE